MCVKVKMKRLLVSRQCKDYASHVNQKPLQMPSCEPVAPKAFGVAAPKNRVGGSAAFSFVFAFQYIGQTLDTPAENGGCGYDFASGVHKYLYAEDDPVNGIDPSGHDETADVTMSSGLMAGLGQFAARVAGQGLLFALKNPGLVRAFLIVQGFMTLYAAHEDPSQAYLYFETGGFAADAEVITSAATDLRGAMVLYKNTDGLGRSCGIFARLTKENIGGGSPVPSFIKVPGYDPKLGLQRGHLLGDQLGGSGVRLENLTPIYKQVNISSMKRIENQVRRAVDAGGDC
jgi:hypothetical protein